MQFIDRAIKMHGRRYDYSKSKYVKIYDSVLIICKIHGPFKQSAASHLNGSGCPMCAISKGETRIAKWLKSQKIKFVQQYSDEGCRNINKLEFDFMITINGHMAIIEYDGKQHYEYVPYFGKQSYKNTLKRDKIKNEFCKRKRIPILRIRYDEDKLMGIKLEKFVTKLASRKPKTTGKK